MIARHLFENTQKVALGNIPDGFSGVGLNFVSMISSCMIPHIRYDIWSPKKQQENSATAAKVNFPPVDSSAMLVFSDDVAFLSTFTVSVMAYYRQHYQGCFFTWLSCTEINWVHYLQKFCRISTYSGVNKHYIIMKFWWKPRQVRETLESNPSQIDRDMTYIDRILDLDVQQHTYINAHMNLVEYFFRWAWNFCW